MARIARLSRRLAKPFRAFLQRDSHLISRYLNELSDLRRATGEARESVVREAL